MVLEVEDLALSYGTKQIFSALNLSLERGSSAAIIGASGSGKSSFLSILLGLLKPTAGAAYINGQQVAPASQSTSARIRREHVGVIFQGGELAPELSPADNVRIAGLLAGMSATKSSEKARGLLNDLGVPELERTAQLSGGEQQRVAVARALMNDPGLIVADEPTASLDHGLRDEVLDLVDTIAVGRGCSLLLVSHDLEVAAGTDQVWQLAGGALSAITL